MHNGHKFGLVRHDSNHGTMTWRCIAQPFDKLAVKVKRCNGIIETKIINGFEMLQPKNISHTHR